MKRVTIKPMIIPSKRRIGKEYYKIRLSVSSLKAILCESGQKCSIGGVVSINLAGSQQPEIRHKGPLHIYIYIYVSKSFDESFKVLCDFGEPMLLNSAMGYDAFVPCTGPERCYPKGALEERKP